MRREQAQIHEVSNRPKASGDAVVTDPPSSLNLGRMLSDGVPYFDIEVAQRLEASTAGIDWFDFWTGRSRY